MNPQQMAQQIKHELEQVAWPSGSGDSVFGASSGQVIIFSGFPREDMLPWALPAALIRIASFDADPDDPELLTQRFEVYTAVDVPGDPHGEFAVIGGPTADIGTSGMRGATEIDARIRSAIQTLNGADGAPIIISSGSGGDVTPLDDNRHIVISQLNLECLCTSALYHQSPEELVDTADTWTWDNSASSRYDFLQYRLGWVAGSTPASTPGATTIVYTGTAATTTHTAGASRAYSIFADYGHRGGSSVAYSSDGSVVGSYVTT